MGEARDNDAYEEELLDYDEDEEKAPDSAAAKASGESVKKSRNKMEKKRKKKNLEFGAALRPRDLLWAIPSPSAGEGRR
ncbi:hypothetical protein B296_00002371 [Ensete ventricosum]|uniref:Uncharacterized protein n=1 Tax=Ensete ventricosum TaxID=4639 RepID=A0A427B3C0_ENSVE|nr:hypothetical protein B296_00002371 [Ensete ventricosum]